MTAPGYTGTPAQFAKADADVSAAHGQMQTNLNLLRSNIEATRAGWQGDAAKIFNQFMVEFDDKGRKLLNVLGGISELLQQSGVAYQRQEENVANDQLGHIRAGLQA